MSTALAAVLLAGCFTTTADFKTDAESFIETTIAEALTEGGETVAFSAVTCEQPREQTVGTRFVCTAIDQNGGTWEFDNEIDTPESFVVNVRRRP